LPVGKWAALLAASFELCSKTSFAYGKDAHFSSRKNCVPIFASNLFGAPNKWTIGISDANIWQ
jgi:hypothetical protein